MKKTGAWLVRYALEQLGISHTFGIPGVHNTEIYDELNNSELIEPILVTHEGAGAFMADAVSRTSDSTGALVIVPAAGVTHAASGIGEASLDGIPMLVISGGVRSDSAFQYQLHDMDQHKLLEPITKATFKIRQHSQIIPTLFHAHDLAVSGEPGPVFVEVPVNIQIDAAHIDHLPEYSKPEQAVWFNNDAVDRAARMLSKAKKPGIFIGWGAVHAAEISAELAELLGAPVATTLQGLSAFPGNHPLHTGMGIGAYAVPASENAFKDCDCLLAVGTRFSEIATGSFGMNVPDNLIHIDINSKVFHANYPAKLALNGDSAIALQLILEKLKAGGTKKRLSDELEQQIAKDKKRYLDDWLLHNSKKRVNPGAFFKALRSELDDEAIIVADDGNHTFLTAELIPIHTPGGFISPTDFNCMGYAVPAAIAAKMVNPEKQVAAIIGDGAFLMTGLELVTAANYNQGVVFIIFSDGELSQIAQAQSVPYNRKTCTVLGEMHTKGIAIATGVEHLSLTGGDDIEAIIKEAFKLAKENKPVILDVKVDYSKKTRFTKGILGTNIKRLNLDTAARMAGRGLIRKITG